MPTKWKIPPWLATLTIACLGAATLGYYYLMKDGRDADAMRAHGRDATAAITDFHVRTSEAKDHSISYSIAFAWRDGSGAERHYGPTNISGAYAKQIAPKGFLVIRQTAIRYLEEDSSARPIIVSDADERAFQDGVARAVTMVLGAIGLALAGLTAWRTRRVSTNPSSPVMTDLNDPGDDKTKEAAN
jgi:hypothetical protein